MIPNILNFLNQLSENNTREWFAANKPHYDAAKADFETITARFIKEITVFDADIRGLQPRDCIFRIFRDVRFGKDKSPYKTNFGASFNKSGKKIHNAGYYFHLEPNACFIGGGIYMPEPDQLKAIRQEIYYNYDEFSAIINQKDFVRYFASINGSRLSLPPKGYPKDFAGIEILKFKDFTTLHQFNPLQYPNDQLFDYSLPIFHAMKPLNDFLNRAISG